jgi:hypothetical protein
MCIKKTFLDMNFCFWLRLIRTLFISHLSTEVAQNFRVCLSVLWMVWYIESNVKLLTLNLIKSTVNLVMFRNKY